MDMHPIIKYVIIGMLILIIGTLGTALYSMLRGGREAGTSTVKALTLRVALSIALFVLLMVLYALGIIHPRGH
ncbi:MAG: twin transmembrane helix small protein [Gammaproteobacteria bacterium]|nr:twin transmembrane helix small protein [Gammaproteobacteria bacterium]